MTITAPEERTDPAWRPDDQSVEVVGLAAEGECPACLCETSQVVLKGAVRLRALSPLSRSSALATISAWTGYVGGQSVWHTGGVVDIKIRRYRTSESVQVGRLIADTFREFNLSYASSEEQEKLLGPFRHAHSDDEAHQEAIARLIHATWVWVATDGKEIVGVLRGSPGRLHSLFVSKRAHRQGIGRRLMNAFEKEALKAGVEKITMVASLYAVPFYQSLGYKRTTRAYSTFFIGWYGNTVPSKQGPQ